MKLLRNYFEKPLTAKQKEKFMTIFGTVMIVTLTITSAFSFDIRNENILQAMNAKVEIVKKG
jgi:hypothetical protein